MPPPVINLPLQTIDHVPLANVAQASLQSPGLPAASPISVPHSLPAPAGGIPSPEPLEDDTDFANCENDSQSTAKRICTYLIEELKSISKVQWLVMMFFAAIGLPWAYRSYKLACWTAKLKYLQECRTTLDALVGRARHDCEAALQKGVAPPPGFDIPDNNQTIIAMINTAQLHQDGRGAEALVFIPNGFWLGAAALAPLVKLAVMKPKRLSKASCARLHSAVPASNKLRPLVVLLGSLLLMTLNYGVITPQYLDLSWRGFAAYQDSCSITRDRELPLSLECQRLLSAQVLTPPALPIMKLPELETHDRTHQANTSVANTLPLPSATRTAVAEISTPAPTNFKDDIAGSPTSITPGGWSATMVSESSAKAPSSSFVSESSPPRSGTIHISDPQTMTTPSELVVTSSSTLMAALGSPINGEGTPTKAASHRVGRLSDAATFGLVIGWAASGVLFLLLGLWVATPPAGQGAALLQEQGGHIEVYQTT
ncbi:hypothetical protein LTS10_006079 [Elasticomyces elasticus]|nr:hypothetical protein LTS10_006079 [Elasticomyces elasticus]